MAFPEKFRSRLELTKAQLPLPTGSWLSYAVCGCAHDSCGWEGWILESVYQIDGKEKLELSIDDRQICPECGKALFRTEASLRFIPSADQKPDLVPGVDYTCSEMQYEKTEPCGSPKPLPPSAPDAG